MARRNPGVFTPSYERRGDQWRRLQVLQAKGLLQCHGEEEAAYPIDGAR